MRDADACREAYRLILALVREADELFLAIDPEDRDDVEDAVEYLLDGMLQVVEALERPNR